MYSMSLFFPLLSFIILGLFGQQLGRRISNFVACCLLLLSLGGALYIFWTVVLSNKSSVVPLLTWIEVGYFKAVWALDFNPLSASMLLVVIGVSFFVHVYSTEYMSHDATPPRFMAYLGLFTFMMIMLVTATDMLQLFFGWEGVGLASYLLIGYWYERPSANTAAFKAFVVNRVGDLGLILGIAGLFFIFKTLNIDTILASLSTIKGVEFGALGFNFPAVEVICFCLFIGAMGKSAQLGLHTWLPDAMEGPTPVSALIHAATMVTAGVFLVARLSPLYELAPYVQSMIIVVGATTALFAGTIAMTQNDIKRIIAYSTCSQLGYMFLATGLSAYDAALFHLITHACFKALLFLGAGAVIHAMSDEQDIRKMGGLWRSIPVTFIMMIVGSLALSGVPFFSGFYSKEAILEAAAHHHSKVAYYGHIVALVAAFLTSFYSWRLVFITFLGKSRADERVQSHIHEPGIGMIFPLLALSLGAIFLGWLAHEALLSPAYWRHSLVTHMGGESHTSMVLPLTAGLGGIVFSFIMYVLMPTWPSKCATFFKALYHLFLHKWYFDEIYTAIFVKPAQALGKFLWVRGDNKLIDSYGPDGVADAVGKAAYRVKALQTGYVNHYAYVMVVAVTALLFYALL